MPTSTLYTWRAFKYFFEAWKARGGKTIVEVAREKVKKIIASHEPKHLDRDIKSRLDEIIKEAEMKKIP
jgi:trimethylamine--corrinoid protein Co-methyltransferase